MDPVEIEEVLLQAAEEHVKSVDLAPVRLLLDPNLGRMALGDWARSRYGVEITLEEITGLQPDAVTEMICERLRARYHRREVEYPVEWVMSRAFRDSAADSAYSADVIARWVKLRFNQDWTPERVQGKPVDKLGRELVALNEQYVDGDRLEVEVDQAIARHHNGELHDWARGRFGPAYDAAARGDDGAPGREELLDAGRRLLRTELTHLERYVLLNIYDQAWKDHLREMDHLKHAIMQRPLGGDQTHPQSQYAIEGADYYNEMWLRIRERVTDSIFKVRLVGAEERRATPQDLEARHDDSTGGGFASAAQAADQAAAMRAQGEAAKPKTIRRAQPKVGRNDPCPCGSGKKYKQCHGRK
jgi:preprotein translocase subunit SecA